MTRPSEQTRYVVHHTDGRITQPLDLQAVRDMIIGHAVTVRDRISRDGSVPVEFYLFDELVDLWDVDSDLLGLYDDPRSRSDPARGMSLAADGETLPSGRSRTRAGGLFHPEAPVEEMPGAALPLPADGPPGPLVKQSTLDEMAVEQAMPPPLVSLNGVAGSVTAAGAESATLDGLPVGALANGDRPGGLVSAAPGGSGEFRGYDPLQGELLDPITIYELLIDSSLYTVLAVSPRATPEAIRNAFSNRVGQVAALARRVSEKDRAQFGTLEEIRRLVTLSHGILRDPERRRSYHESAGPSDAFASVRTFLSGDAGVSVSAEVPAAVTSVSAEVPAAVTSVSAEGLVAADSRPFGRTGLRVYTSPFDVAVASPANDSTPVSDVFPERFPGSGRPSGGRREPGPSRREGPAAGRADRKLPRGDKALSTSRWQGSAVPPLQGLAEVLGLTALACVTSLVVVLLTDLGQGELDYGSPSAWFFGRALMLIGLAALATIAIRKEPISRLGLGGAPVYLAIGAGTGVLMGVLGSRIAPIYVAGGPGTWVVVLSLMALETLSHEVFFRGYVTRVLLDRFKESVAAIAVGCLLYGAFYLTYYNVLQIRGYFLFYYSVLLFGLGAGGVFGWLYYKSRSIWPAALAHFLAISLSALLAP